MNQSLAIRHLSFSGPGKISAALNFEKGLNVLYGASETGKSFTLEAIDYMLGGAELRDIPERVGYDVVLLGMETSAGEMFTLMRSTNSGQFKVYEGLYSVPPDDEIEFQTLLAKHSSTNEDNISTFLLKKIGLENKRLKYNAKSVTKNLSFRVLSKLCLITEENIQKRRTPIEDGQKSEKTIEFSLFKLLLTGVDDSSLVSSEDNLTSQSKKVKLEFIDEMIQQYESQLGSNPMPVEGLMAQFSLLESSIKREESVLKRTDSALQELLVKKRKIRGSLDDAVERQAEIGELSSRFALLQKHYESDLERLEGIVEAGALVSVLEKSNCPLCGSYPENQHLGDECEGDLGRLVVSASAESKKIGKLKSDLLVTLEQLDGELKGIQRLLPDLKSGLRTVEIEIEDLTPSVHGQRSDYADLINKRSEVQDAIRGWDQIKSLKEKRERFVSEIDVQKSPEGSSIDLSSATLDDFARIVEHILKEWNFPDSDRVFFDSKTRDLIIAGKKRGSRGKGMRAITHAAFSCGLMQYCKSKNLPHPGFLVLDSPLLAYREPENEEDDLSNTDVQNRMYSSMASFTDRQVIIIENVDPPAEIKDRPTSTMFSKNKELGRYGLFAETSTP